jgi:hypothetical protein
MTPSSHEVTQLLLAWNQGDKSALDQLMPLVYNAAAAVGKRIGICHLSFVICYLLFANNQ